MDRATGFVYLRSRWYAPQFGRFVIRDIWAGDYLIPDSFNKWSYVYSNPVNHVDPSGMCIFCEVDMKVRVDGRNGNVELLDKADLYNSTVIGALADNSEVTVLSEKIHGQIIWRKIKVNNSGQAIGIEGFVADEKLLDQCNGGLFGCFPKSPFPILFGNRTGRKTFGFGPNDYARKNCSSFGYGLCPYTALRGLHNGLDIPGNPGDYVIWPGNRDGFIENINTGDGDPNIAVSYGGKQVIFGHTNLLDEKLRHTTVRPGQVIGTVDEDHLHLGFRKGRRFYNPLLYFSTNIQLALTRYMDRYPGGYGPYSMVWFDTKHVKANFWSEECTDNLFDIGWYPTAGKNVQ